MRSAYTIDENGDHECIELRRALAAAVFGEIVVVPNGLETSGSLSIVSELFLDEIASLTSPSVSRAISSAGLNHLHEHLDPREVATLLTRLDRRARVVAVPLARTLVEAMTTEPRPPYFICSRLWVRAQVPYRLVEECPELLAAEHLVGHLLPATAHRDFWLTHPRGTISIWGALGPVRAGNTVALSRDGDVQAHQDVASDRSSGGTQVLPDSTVAPELDRGDVLVFNADRLHASVRNETDETRVSITSRVVMGRRLRYGPGSHWRAYYDARLLDTRLERLATLQSVLTRAAVRRWRARRRLARAQRRPNAAPTAVR
jgi:hypothetical protein